MLKSARLLPALGILMLAGVSAGPPLAGGWPQFLGPARDGTVEGKIEPWTDAGPRKLWRTRVGAGFSGPVVTGGRVLLHHREGGLEILQAFAAETGKPLWNAAQPTDYRDGMGMDEGPRGTPAVADGVAFTFGAAGRLSAVQVSDGKTLWSHPVGTDLGADKGFFGFACSPLVWSNRVIVQVGGRPGAGVVAFDVSDGKVVWKATDDEAGYASPIVAPVGGRPRLLVFNRAGLVVLEPASGRELSRQAWRSRQSASVNAASPLVLSQGVFVTASYGTGASLWRTDPEGLLTAVWSGDEQMSAHFATPVAWHEFLFGFHGRQEEGPDFRCIEAATGRVQWTVPRLGAGSVMRVGDSLLVLKEDGELLLGVASSERWRVVNRAQVLGTGTRASPAFADGRWFGRDKNQLIALELTPRR